VAQLNRFADKILHLLFECTNSATRQLVNAIEVEGWAINAWAAGMQEEMLGSVRDSGDAEWSVLMMDTITTKVMSSSCRISDVLDYGVSCESSDPPITRPLLTSYA